MIKDYLLGLCLDCIKDKVKHNIDLKRIDSVLEDYIDRCLKDNSLCSKEEEIDFQGLCDYLKSSCLKDINTYICSDGEKRISIKGTIIEKAKGYSKSKATPHNSRLTPFSLTCLHKIRHILQISFA